jgi:serine/threonine protein phosphatase PrpC
MSQFSFSIRSVEDIVNVPTLQGVYSDDFIPLSNIMEFHDVDVDGDVDNNNETKMVRTMTSDIAQLGSKQDSVFTGIHVATKLPFDKSSPERIDNENFEWMILADGHGSDSCIVTGKRTPSMVYKNLFDKLDMDKLACSIDPATYIREQIPDSKYNVALGATFILVKIFGDSELPRAEFYSIGDSQCRMYKNDTLVYKNELHKPYNLKEVERLNVIPHWFMKDHAPVILSDTELEMASSSRIYFMLDKISLALTQSIGHHHVTGILPERVVIPFDLNDHIQIVIGSDGVFDVLNDVAILQDQQILSIGTATDILRYAENRWKQSWKQVCRDKNGEYYVHDPDTHFNEYDDISVAVWNQKE